MNKALTCFILVLAVSAAASTSYKKPQINEMFAAGKECMRILNIPLDSDIIERVFYNRNVIKDEETLKYFECSCEKLGWADENGNLLQQPMIDFFAQNAPRKLVEDVFKKCKDFYAGSSVGEKLFNFHACYFTNKKF